MHRHTHTTHTYPGEEKIEIKSFFRKYKLINKWIGYVTRSRDVQLKRKKTSSGWWWKEWKKSEKRITHTNLNSNAKRGIKCFFTSSSIFVVVITCYCWFLSTSTSSPSSPSSSTSSSFLVNNPNPYTYTNSHANTYKHGLNFNVKWLRATKYNGNLSKFHYDIPLHNVIRAVVFFG